MSKHLYTLVVCALFSSSLAIADNVDDDLDILNKIFGTQISKQNLGNILALSTPENEREVAYTIEQEELVRRFRPLTALAYFGQYETVQAMVKAFEDSLVGADRDFARASRFSFYDGLMRGLEARRQWEFIYALVLSDNTPNTYVAKNIVRRLWFVLLQNENLQVLARFHNPAPKPDRHEKSSGSINPYIYRYQPRMSELFNTKEMTGLIVRDVIENLIKSRGTPDEAGALHLIRLLIVYYSNPEILTLPEGHHGDRALTFAFDVRPYFIEQAEQWFKPEFGYLMDTLRSIWNQIMHPPQPESLGPAQSKQPKPTSYDPGKTSVTFKNIGKMVGKLPMNKPVGETPLIEDSAILIRDRSNEKVKVKRLQNVVPRPPADQAVAKLPRDEVISGDMEVLRPPAPEPIVKKTKRDRPETCSDLALLILQGHSEEFILRAIDRCSNARVCSVDRQTLPTGLLMVQEGKIELFKKFSTNRSEICGLDETCQDQTTLREVIFDYLVSENQYSNVAHLLTEGCFFGTPETKSKLLMRLVTLYLQNKISAENLDIVVSTPGVFENPLGLSQTTGSGGLLDRLVDDLVAKKNVRLLKAVLSSPWFIEPAAVSRYAHERFLKVINTKNDDAVALWLDSGLMNLNEEFPID